MAYKSIARDEEEAIADKARQKEEMKELKIKLEATKARQKEEMMVSCFLHIIKYLDHISLPISETSHASSLY